jgi:uncharacterized protein YndB with AHSA1/START domain
MDDERPELTLRRWLKTAPEKAYQAWTNPELIARWWGPAGSAFLGFESDLRVGGRYSLRSRLPDGDEHGVSGVYREVVPGERLAFTWAWRSTPERESLVTLSFTPSKGGTELVLHHSRFFDDTARDRHRGGWNAALDKLVEIFS